MAVRASTRISIRWPPEQASEPTDTLVLSVGDYYVDLRVTKSDRTIDWALAGQRIVVSEDPLKIEFSHPFDSHESGVSNGAESTPDVGQFTKLPNGDDFETGEMAAPHLGGKIMPYEEVWRELSLRSIETEAADPDPFAWILESAESDDGASKAFYAKAGKFFLGVRRTESRQTFTFSAIRQDFDDASKTWITKYSIGDVDEMWTVSDAKDKTLCATWKVGEQITVGRKDGSQEGEVYLIRAIGE